MAVLAVFGCIGMILFQAVFVFELYRLDYSAVEPYIPAALRPALNRFLIAGEEADSGVPVPEPPAEPPPPAEPEPPPPDPAPPAEEPAPEILEIVPVG